MKVHAPKAWVQNFYRGNPIFSESKHSSYKIMCASRKPRHYFPAHKKLCSHVVPLDATLRARMPLDRVEQSRMPS